MLNFIKCISRSACSWLATFQEFKVITKLPIAQFKAWEDKGFEPEGQFLADLRSIAGQLVHIVWLAYLLTTYYATT
eukprot:5065366-Amphidinium_carterae.1